MERRSRAPTLTRGNGGSGVSALDAHVGFWLRFLSNHVSGRFRRLVEENGVSLSEWVALRALYARPSSTKAATPAVLIRSLGMTKGAVSKVLDRLESKGLARRVTDAGDQRAQQVQLTRAGRALVPRLARIADDNDQYFFAHLSAESRDALMRTLRQIVIAHELTQVPTA